MLPIRISHSILSVGCPFKHPKGGVAQVMNSYQKYVFTNFRCVVNSGGINNFDKIFRFITSFIITFFILLFDRKIKIIHIHTASYNSFARSSYWIRLSKFLNKKVILHIHGGGFKEYYNTNPRWIHSMLDKCDCIITLSQSWYDYYANELGFKNVEVVENIVPKPILSKSNITDDKFHILFLGLITEQKGIFNFLEMLYEHKDYFYNRIVFHIGGIGKVDKLLGIIRDLELENCVVYEGFVDGPKKVQLFNISDAYVLPSYIEGLPISILEAMSYSLPILSTPVGGIPEVVIPGKNGFLFDPDNKDEMFNSLMNLIEDQCLSKTMGKESYNMVQPNLPINVERKLRNIYQSLLGNN